MQDFFQVFIRRAKHKMTVLRPHIHGMELNKQSKLFDVAL